LVSSPVGTRSDIAVSWLAAVLPGLYLLLTSTSTLVPGIWPYDVKRMLQFTLLFLLFLLPALNRRIRKEFGDILAATPGWIRGTLLVMFGLGLLSAVTHARSDMHLANSLSDVVLLGLLIAAVFVVGACRRIGNVVFDRIAVAMMAATTLAVGTQELFGVAAAHAAGTEFSYSYSLINFSHPRFFNQVQSWTIPVIAALPLLLPRFPLARWVCVVALGLSWYVLFMTAGRGSAVGLATAFIFSALAFPFARAALLKWQAAGLVVGVMIFAAVLFSFEGGFHEFSEPGRPESSQPTRGATDSTDAAGVAKGESRSPFLAESFGRPMAHTSGRSAMWSHILRDSLENPVLGIGPMNYACISGGWFGHPHNFPLQIAGEWGIPAALALFAIVVFLLVTSVSGIRQNTLARPEVSLGAVLFFTGASAAAVHACFSGVLVMPASQVTGIVICGILLGMMNRGSAKRRSTRLRWLFVPGLLLSASLTALGSYEISSMVERAAQLPTARVIAPRMWQDAKVCRLYIGRAEVNK
jgi:hypothetical protein